MQLNDLDVGPDGTIHVTDTGINMSRKGVIYRGPSRIFVLGANRQISISTPPTVSWPNGIKWDAGNRRWLELLPNGALLFASWADSSIHLLDGGTDRPIVRQVPEPADIGIDTRRQRLAIPLSVLGRVQLWDISNLVTSRR